MNEPFDRYSDIELANICLRYSAAQHDLAAKTNEDFTYWHHFTLAQMLSECSDRLAKLHALTKSSASGVNTKPEG